MIAIQIIYNLAILVAFSVISDIINRYFSSSKLFGKVAQGIIFGIVAIIAMMNPLVISEGLIFDGRSVVLSLCALFFGPVAGLISGIIALGYRIYIGGIGVYVGSAVIGSSVIIGLIFNYLIKRKIFFANISIVILYFFGILVHIAMLLIFIQIPNGLREKTFETIAITVIIFYPFATVLIGMILQNQLSHRALLVELEDQKESLAITLNSIGDGVISVDMNGKIVHLNKVAEKICGVLENQVVGNHVEEIFNIHSIENLPLIDDILNEVFSTGQPKLIFNQIKLISIDFKEYFLTCNFSPIQNRTNETEGIVIAFSDITLQNDLKSSLVQSEELFRAVFESSANSLIVFNIEGNISKVNEAFYSLFGYSKKEIDTNKISYQDLTYLEDIAMSSDTFNNLISGKIQNASFEKRFISKNNDLFWGLVTTAIVYKHDKTPLFVVSQIVNISERKNAEIELKASNDELSHITMELSLAKDKAENSDRIKTAFLANMSHEIRTPMNGIIGVADLLVESNLEIEERKRFVEIMHSSCNRLLSTINDIFDASKIASNQIELVETEFSISSLIDNLNNHFNPLFIQKQLLFKVKVLASIDLNKTLLGDYQKLFQILSNLLNNALKFTHQGMVTLTCDFQKTNYQFLIEDTGVGISDEYKKNIFSNFSQEDMSMNRGFEGSGLGLVIAKGYAELLNGTIRFNSEKNVGSTFILEVPLKDIVEISTSSKKIISNPDLFELTFLVAEDDDISFYLVEKLLKREFGATVIRAKNGMEAYNLFVNNQNIEIILMDIKMPIMDGFECVEKIRLINNEIPIIAVTAYAFSADQQMAIEVGCNDYISKPYNWSLLIEKIKSFVG